VRWQQLYDDGEFEQARSAVEEQGGFDAVLGQASPEQLFALSDLARPDNRAIALAALREVVNNYPNNPNAPIAAYQLGVMLKKAGDLAGAARAFAVYRALSPDGDFSEDALARQVEAAIEQGELFLARQLAEQYAKEFPTGERLDEFREELETAVTAVQPGLVPDAGSPEPVRPAEVVEDDSPGDPPDAP
jgi:TolA-binding protein